MEIFSDNPATRATERTAGEQLAKGFRWLRFSPRLESAFRNHEREAGLPQLRVALLLGFSFGLSFLALDYFVGTLGLSDPRVLYRFMMNQSLVMVMFAATFFTRAQPHLGWLGVLVCLNLALSSLFITSVGAAQAIGTPYAGYLLLIFYTYFFVGLRFWPALATASTVVLVITSVFTMQGMPAGPLLYNSLFLFFANLIGAMGLYNVEYNRRLSFLEARELQKMAGSDALTGLANRTSFNEHLRRTWRNGVRTGEALTVAMLDVDQFKKFNDRFGHQAGDHALTRVAALVAEVGDRPLDLAARYGGEEFVLTMPGCTLAHAQERLETLRQRVLELHIANPDSEVGDVITISAGVAQVFPQETKRSVDGLVQMADEALYSAKQQGRNRVVVAAEDPELITGLFDYKRLSVAG
jgi:diguanylate cyclase (GGDEF)-like protein